MIGPLREDGASAGPILKYYAFEATRRASFSVPIFVLFYTSRGLSLAQVGLLEALWTVVVLVFEAPTGYLGDRIGRRWSLVIGTLLSATGAVAFVFAHSFPVFAGIALLRGIAHTFKSGAQEAWLYDTLQRQSDEDQFAHHAGHAGALATVSHGGAALVGGALYSVDPTLPWLLEGVVVGSGALVVLSIRHPQAGSREVHSERLSVSRAIALARDTLWTRDLGVFTVYTALLFGLLNTLSIYVQPVSTEVLGIDPARLGFVYAGLAAVSAGVTSRAGWFDARVGARNWYVITPPAVALSLVAVSVAPLLTLPVFVLARSVGSASRPLFAQYFNDRTESDGRATLLSVSSTVRSLATAPLNVLGGALAGIVSLPTAMSLLGTVLFAGSVLALVTWRESVPP